MIYEIHPHHIDRAWRDGADCLDKAMDGEMTPGQLKMMALRGEVQILGYSQEPDAIPVAWFAVQFENRPNNRCLVINGLASNDSSTEICKSSINEIIDYARDHGASYIEGAAKKAQARLYRTVGFGEVLTVMRMNFV